MDRFSNFARAPGAPYTSAVGLVPSEDEIEPTAAIHVNWSNVVITVLSLDSDEPVTLCLDRGTHYLRIRKFLAIDGEPGATSTFGSSEDVPLVVGLY